MPISSIDNSPIESSGKGGFEPPHKVLETFMLPLTSFAYWNGTPTQIPTENTEFVALEFMQLAYGSIEEVGIIGPSPLASLDKPNELYCDVVSRNRSQFVIC